MTTSLPRARPDLRYRTASAVSLSGYVRSTTGMTLPASISSFRTQQVRRALLRGQGAKPLAHEHRLQRRAEDLALEAAEPPSAPFASDDHERPLRCEGAPQVRQRAVSTRVEDQVVRFRAVCEVLARVVDDMVGADRQDEVGLRRAAHAGHIGSERLRQLDGERAHASCRADDQDALPCSNLASVAEAEECRTAGHGDGRGLLEGEVPGLGRELLRPSERVLGEGAVAGAEDLVTRLEPGHVLADRLDLPGHIPADACSWVRASRSP